MVRGHATRRLQMSVLTAMRERRDRPVAKHPVRRTHKGKSARVTSEQPEEDLYGRVEEPETDVDTCRCGCGRQVTRMLSVLLQRYFASKRRWLRSLKVAKWRSQDLERVSTAIEEKGLEAFDGKGLDLDIIQLDVSRQQWLTDEADAKLVKQALVTFCVVNNVGYWQGLHDVAAALVYMTPRPSTGELAAILEKLVLNFASILLRTTDENILSDAGKISAKWRLMFQFFFPGAANEMEKISDFNSWNINWFLTMGFYRFGCAHIVLGYVYTVILCSAGCMTGFMYQELGYLGVRGHMKWLMNKDVEYRHFTNNLFDDHLDDALLSRALTNSKMVLLNAEELINVSRNLYDTLNDVDCEMADFPLVAILKFAAFFFNKSPLVLYKNNDVQPKTVVQIGISDIFKANETQRSMECQSKQSQVIAKVVIKKKRGRRWKKHMSNISGMMNNEILGIYLKNLHANVLKKSFIFQSKFAGGVSQKGGAFYFNVVDVRSEYLRYGEPLESFFGNEAAVYMSGSEIDFLLKEATFSPIFTIWVIVTDDGYDNPMDPMSLESLDRGVDLYRLLSRTFSGVALLRGGYTALLRWKNLAIPSKFNLTFFKKILDWIPATKEPVPKISIENVMDTTDDVFRDLSARCMRNMSGRIDVFRNWRYPSEVGKAGSILQGSGNGGTIRLIACNKYSTYIGMGCHVFAIFSSDGGIKVNGLVWHPDVIAKYKTNVTPSCILHVATLFQVTSIDGIMEIVPKASSVPGALNILKKQVSDFQEIMAAYVVVLRGDEVGAHSIPESAHVFKLVTKLVPMCRYTTQHPMIRQWRMELISIRSITRFLICGEMHMKTHLSLAAEQHLPEEDEQELGGNDNAVEVPYRKDNSWDDFMAEHPFKVPLDKVMEMLDAKNVEDKRKECQVDVVRLKSFGGVTAMNSDVRQGLASSERRTHVFSRRIKAHPKIVETLQRAPSAISKQPSMTNAGKNVFIPRNQIKRAQNV